MIVATSNLPPPPQWCDVGIRMCLVVTQLCPSLCDPMDYSLLGSSVHGIIQARILEWVTIFSSRGSSPARDPTCVSWIGRWILYHWVTWKPFNVGIIFPFSLLLLLLHIFCLFLSMCNSCFPGGSDSSLSTMREPWVWSLGRDDSLEKEMATHSSILAWRIPWTEEFGAGYCPWGCREVGMTEWIPFPFSIPSQIITKATLWSKKNLINVYYSNIKNCFLCIIYLLN